MKRYGRNQKRRARETIARLEADLAAEKQRAAQAEYALRLAHDAAMHAEAVAFRRFAGASGLLEIYARQIGVQLGAALGDQMIPIARQIMERTPPEGRWDFRVQDNPIAATVGFTTIVGVIPEIRYAVRVAHTEMESAP